MRQKSEHIGECQACGRVLKLPHGVLMNHVYDKEWTHTSGKCPGSRELPFEVSLAVAKTAEERASQHKSELEKLAESIKAGELLPDGKAWCLIGNEWGRFEICSGTNGFRFGYRDHTGNLSPLFIYEDSFVKARRYLDQQYLKNALTPQLLAINKYLQWQQSRLSKWKKRPLRQSEGEII